MTHYTSSLIARLGVCAAAGIFYVDDSGGESDALRPEQVSLERKIPKVLTHRVVRPVCPSGKIVESVIRDHSHPSLTKIIRVEKVEEQI